MNWITDSLPDEEMTVLMRLPQDSEYPIWPGFRDNNKWCSCDGSTVVGPVAGWMELETAAKALDANEPSFPQCGLNSAIAAVEKEGK